MGVGVVAQLAREFSLSAEGAISLTAAAEYVCAEVHEYACKAATTGGSPRVMPWHVLESIWDETGGFELAFSIPTCALPRPHGSCPPPPPLPPQTQE